MTRLGLFTPPVESLWITSRGGLWITCGQMHFVCTGAEQMHSGDLPRRRTERESSAADTGHRDSGRTLITTGMHGDARNRISSDNTGPCNALRGRSVTRYLTRGRARPPLPTVGEGGPRTTTLAPGDESKRNAGSRSTSPLGRSALSQLADHHRSGLPSEPMPLLRTTHDGRIVPDGQHRTRHHRAPHRAWRNGPAYDAWRRTVLARSDRCEICGKAGTARNPLTAGHVIPASRRPDLRLSPQNGRVECRDCNSRAGTTTTRTEHR